MSFNLSPFQAARSACHRSSAVAAAAGEAVAAAATGWAGWAVALRCVALAVQVAQLSGGMCLEFYVWWSLGSLLQAPSQCRSQSVVLPIGFASR
jgi:hypothetical protein